MKMQLIFKIMMSSLVVWMEKCSEFINSSPSIHVGLHQNDLRQAPDSIKPEVMASIESYTERSTVEKRGAHGTSPLTQSTEAAASFEI